MIAWPSGNTHLSTCGLMLTRSMPAIAREARDVDLVVEVADVADDRLVLHALPCRPRVMMSLLPVVVMKMSAAVEHFLERLDLVALHRRLQRADRVDLGDDHARALAAQRFRAALADVAEAAHDRDLAADHHVGRAVDAVDQRVPAAVEVVELGLRDGVVDVDRREQQLAGLDHLVEPVHAGGRLLGHAFDALADARPALRVLARASASAATRITLNSSESALRRSRAPRRRASYSVPLCTSSVASPPSSRIMFGPAEPSSPSGQRSTCSVHHQYSSSVSPFHAYTGTPAGVLGRAVGTDRDRRRGVVLGGEDVAAAPAHLGAERRERLDQHGRLDRHVQRAGDARALQRLRVGVLARGSPSGRASRARRA